MARIRLLEDSELTPAQLQQVQATEAAGGDASGQRAMAHLPDFFGAYFRFYLPGHQEGCVEPELKELVRLKIARLNDGFT